MSKKGKILTHLFWNVIISMILVELTNVGCGFVDGVIISRFLGANAMAVQGVAYPYFSVLGIISGTLATGLQTLCTTYIGEGKKKELNSVFNGVVSGFPAMFANNDLAVYSVSKAHMLVYLIEPASSSNRLELAYLQYAGRVGSPETFAAYHYDIGEPVVYLPDGEVLEGTIVPFAEQDYLDLCRVDEVTDEAVDNIYPFEGNYNVKSNTRLDGTVVVDASRKFAVSGALAPFQVEPEDVSQTEGGLYELHNKFDTVTYTFDDGTTSRTYRKSAVMTRYNYEMRANAYVCYYEFYNVFDGAEVLEQGKTYTVTVQGYDNHGTPIEGAQETVTLFAE